MVPSFMPVIGSGFDAVAGQQAGWAGFNRSVDEGNIARANQAQLNQNNYLAQVASLARQDQASQQAALRQSHQDALQQSWNERTFAREGEKIKGDSEYNKARLTEERARTEAMSAHDKANQERQKLIDAARTENQGTAHTQDYIKRKAWAEASEKNLADLNEKIDSTNEQIKAEKEKGKNQDLTKISNLQRDLLLYEKRLQAADRNNTSAKAHLDALESTMDHQGFKVTDDGVMHVDSGKTWKFPKPKESASKTNSVDPLSVFSIPALGGSDAAPYAASDTPAGFDAAPFMPSAGGSAPAAPSAATAAAPAATNAPAISPGTNAPTQIRVAPKIRSISIRPGPSNLPTEPPQPQGMSTGLSNLISSPFTFQEAHIGSQVQSAPPSNRIPTIEEYEEQNRVSGGNTKLPPTVLYKGVPMDYFKAVLYRKRDNLSDAQSSYPSDYRPGNLNPMPSGFIDWGLVDANRKAAMLQPQR